MACLVEEAQAALSPTSPESDRVARGVARRLRLASAQLRRSVARCESGKTAKARGAVRAASRRVESAWTLAQVRSTRPGEQTRLTTSDVARLDYLVRQLRALAAVLACP